MKQYLEKLLNKQDLTAEEMKDAATNCFSPETSDSELASFLTALRAKGETSEEAAGLAAVIRAQSSETTNTLTDVMDNCGTGGDYSNSFNISTTAAFVIAGAGIKIAKHGNRSISSKTGSADVLEELGISLSFSKDHVEKVLQENNIAFLFAPHVHPGMKRISKVRKELGIPTTFNLIGPLTNPVNLDSQLLGVYRRDMLPMLAEALNQMGRKRAVVVHGAGNMDEASLSGGNHITLLNDGEITSFTLHPADVRLPVYANADIRGDTAKENAAILRGVLEGKRGAYFDTVLLNAGLGIYANGKASTIFDGIELARESIESGAALEKLNYLVKYSSAVAKEAI
ncbi:anthranilate phosphoribosyltransferase [Virgibacillus ihumii]|uniref:anthranilate phosphoribosyltransferase n=1 Tax=Virgibacillus ihumii TaxID=2686091 RepID=UPI00157C5C88|nr:anthranilate phosphoribosyltransferase [Virgibacillus ihumii]